MFIPIVKVVSPKSEENPHGYIVINEGDLADHHELFGDQAGEEGAPPAPARRGRGTKTTKAE